MEATRTSSRVRKRKADNQDNDRLSKRLALLNLERNGQKLYVPVEQPTTSFTDTDSYIKEKERKKEKVRVQDDDMMQMDDTKHKVYIYDLDAELSDSDSSEDGRLVFLPDIEKHLRESRIPPSILANADGELAGQNKEMVLYNVPISLSVAPEHDSVRKAIIETRARARERAREGASRERENNGNVVEKRDWWQGINGMAARSVPVTQDTMRMLNGMNIGVAQQMEEDDPDAMDLG